jgi:hypothetical protein
MAGVGLDWGEANRAMAKSGGGSGGARRFQIKDGETVSIRFIGGKGEPFIWKRHFVKQGKGGTYFVCAEPAQKAGKHEGCVGCMLARQQGKNGALKFPQNVASFSVLDPRLFHMLDEEYQGSKFHLCKKTDEDDDDSVCKFCRKDNKPKLSGVRHWTVAKKVFEQIRDFAKRLSTRCVTCGVGKITTVGYECPECGTEMEPDDPHEEQKCFKCSTSRNATMVVPFERVECSKGCKKPRRASINDAWVNLTRSGEKTETTYNFERGDIESLPAKYAYLKPIDFAKEDEFQPMSADAQAQLLGVRNPFGKKSKFDDSEDDEPPRKKRKLIGGDDDDDDPPRKKKTDDDEDDPFD